LIMRWWSAKKKIKSGILTIWLVWFGSFESVYDYLVGALVSPVDETENMVINW
jgi:hypothetical protein